jgi:threonine/homoserine/homoserine lactone efflux protein
MAGGAGHSPGRILSRYRGALGLAIRFKAVPIFYFALKFAGAAYLVWLGLKLLIIGIDPVETGFEIMEKDNTRAFWEGVAVEILNPKTAIFFPAFLPQFNDPAASFRIWLQLFILGAVINIMFSSADVICVLAAGRLTAFLRQSRSTARIARRIGGGLLVALGFNLTLSRQ